MTVHRGGRGPGHTCRVSGTPTGLVGGGSTSFTLFSEVFSVVGDIGYAWNPTDLTTLKQNLNGTTSVAFNDVVGFATDQSGLGNNLAAITNDVTRPTVVNTNNGLLAFAGGQKLLGIGGFYAKGAMTWIGVIKGANASNIMWAETNSGQTNPVYAPGLRGSGTSSRLLNYQRNDANTAIANSMSVTALDGSVHILVVIDTGTVVKVSIDGGAFVTDSYSRSTLTTNISSMGTARINSTTDFAAFTGNIGAGLVIGRVLGGTLGTAGDEITKAYNLIAGKHSLTTL